MNKLPQTANIADLRNSHLTVLAMLDKGPVVINSRSHPVAVLISPDQWDAAADEHEQLQRAYAVLLAQNASEPGGVDWEEVKAGMKERGQL